MSTVAEAVAAAEAKSQAPVELQSVVASLDRANRIELTFVSPLASDYDEITPQMDAFTRALLGEQLFDHWIGNLAAIEPPRGFLARWTAPKGVPIAELASVVDALVARVRSALPSAPWSATKRAPRHTIHRNATGDSPRSDIVSAETAHLPLFRASVDGGSFAAERYTRHPEVFAYVRQETTDGAALEKRIDEELGDLGATIGHAIGGRFAYVDMALRDVAKAKERYEIVVLGSERTAS